MIRKFLLYILLFSLAAPALAYELTGKTEREVKEDIRQMMSDGRYQEVVELCDQIKEEQFDLKETGYYRYLADRRIREQKEGKRPQKDQKKTTAVEKTTTTEPDKKEPEITETQTTKQPDNSIESTQAAQKAEPPSAETGAAADSGNLTKYLMFAVGGLLLLFASGGIILVIFKSKKSAPVPQAAAEKVDRAQPFVQVEPTVPILETPVAEEPEEDEIHFEQTMVISDEQSTETTEQEPADTPEEPTESFILSDDSAKDDAFDPMTAIGDHDAVESVPLGVDEGTLSGANTEIVLDDKEDSEVEESSVIEIDINAEPGPLSISLDTDESKSSVATEVEQPQPESIKLFDADQDISFGAMDEKTRPPGPQEMPASGLEDSEPQPKSISEMKGREVSLNDTSVFHAAETAALNLHPASAGIDSDDADDDMERTVVRANMRQDALFQEQYRQGVEAYEKEDWKTAVHFLSIALALNGDSEDAKEKLKIARDHRKEHADS